MWLAGRKAILVGWRIFIDTVTPGNTVAVPVDFTAKRVATDQWLGFLQYAGIVKGRPLRLHKFRVAEFQATSATVLLTIKDFPAVVDKRCNVFISANLRADSHNFDSRNRLALIRGLITLTAAK